MQDYRQAHKVFKRAVHLLIVFVVSIALNGCTSSGPEGEKIKAPPGGILLRGAGATFPAPLYKRWFENYQKNNVKTVITYDAVGSGEGIRRFIGTNIKEDEHVDFGASDAAMKDEEMAQVPTGVVLLPITAGSVVLAYNLPDVEGDLKLSRKAYAGIFMGEVKYWNDPLITQTNPGMKLPKFSIATVVRQDSSGTTYAFTKHLDAINEKWRTQHGPATLVNWQGNAMRAKGNEGVAGRINQSIGSIGYVSYEFARKIGLKLALLENKQGNFVKPTQQSLMAAVATAQMPENLRVYIPDPSGRDSYPIVTFSWILLYKRYKNPETATSIRNLFDWCLKDGQRFAPELGYVLLPSNVTQKSLEALNSITAEAHP